MCGLLGFARLDGAPLDTATVRVDGIRDRGPDNVGHVGVGPVDFFHTRLAVINTKVTSNQPIQQGDLTLICNGEIYNHLELRAAAKEYVYKTESDCEAVMSVYAEHGVEGFRSLDGMYSFALHDAKNGLLFLHRDGIGKKPLFLLIDGDKIVFSSNVTAIVDNWRGRPTLDLGQARFYADNGFVHPRHGIFREITPLTPGELVRVDLRTKAITRTFVEPVVDDTSGFDFGDARAVQREIERLVRRAVEKRLAGLRSPVVMFSGGIDSTVVAVESAKTSDVVLMTLKQPARFMNDEPFARSEAKRLGKTLVFGQPWRDFDRKIDDALRKIDQPLSLPSYFITSLLTMDARQYSNVILTGDGGDEVFFGYTAFRNWVQAPTAPAATIEPIPCGAPFRFPLSDYGTRQGSVDLVGHGFVKVDKATAENQMEARCPLVDRDLIAFVRAIPMAFWERPGNVPKQPLVDHLIANGVDRSTIFRRKIGTAWPFRYRMLPRLPRIREELEARRGRLRDLGVELAPRPSIAADFQKFDRLWRDYVLATYLTRVLKA